MAIRPAAELTMMQDFIPRGAILWSDGKGFTTSTGTNVPFLTRGTQSASSSPSGAGGGVNYVGLAAASNYTYHWIDGIPWMIPPRSGTPDTGSGGRGVSPSAQPSRGSTPSLTRNPFSVQTGGLQSGSLSSLGSLSRNPSSSIPSGGRVGAGGLGAANGGTGSSIPSGGRVGAGGLGAANGGAGSSIPSGNRVGAGGLGAANGGAGSNIPTGNRVGSGGLGATNGGAGSSIPAGNRVGAGGLGATNGGAGSSIPAGNRVGSGGLGAANGGAGSNIPSGSRVGSGGLGAANGGKGSNIPSGSRVGSGGLGATSGDAGNINRGPSNIPSGGRTGSGGLGAIRGNSGAIKRGSSNISNGNIRNGGFGGNRSGGNSRGGGLSSGGLSGGGLGDRDTLGGGQGSDSYNRQREHQHGPIVGNLAGTPIVGTYFLTMELEWSDPFGRGDPSARFNNHSYLTKRVLMHEGLINGKVAVSQDPPIDFYSPGQPAPLYVDSHIIPTETKPHAKIFHSASGGDQYSTNCLVPLNSPYPYGQIVSEEVRTITVPNDGEKSDLVKLPPPEAGFLLEIADMTLNPAIQQTNN